MAAHAFLPQHHYDRRSNKWHAKEVPLPDADFRAKLPAMVGRNLSDLAKICSSFPGPAGVKRALKSLQEEVAVALKLTPPELPDPSATLEGLFAELQPDRARQVIEELPSLRNRKANAPLSTPSEYFGIDPSDFERAENRASMMSEWKRAVYEGNKPGPPVDVCETILKAAGVKVLSLCAVRDMLLAIDDRGATMQRV
jgi:hypothetical protein